MMMLNSDAKAVNVVPNFRRATGGVKAAAT